MKKVLLIAVGLIVGTSVIAQEDGGGAKFFVGGNALYGTDNVKDGASYSNYEFGPTFAYMLNEKMGVGINLSFTGDTWKQNNDVNNEVKNSGYNISPFFRYYFAGAGNFKFYGDVNVAFGGGKELTTEDNTNDKESKYSSFGFGINPGAQYWFTDNWSMAAEIGMLDYVSRTDKKGEVNGAGESMEEVTNQFDIGGVFNSLNLSLFYHF